MYFSEGQYVHMVGVCGVGMAGVARLLVARGCVVSGCDVALNDLAQELQSIGVVVSLGHDVGHIESLPADALIVMTPAVPEFEPEIQAARRQGLRIVSRGEALAALSSAFACVAVCGTHGKTTTSCFAARLFQELDVDVGWCIGGRTATLGQVASAGAGEVLVVEADESDGTLRAYHPSITVLGNIDIDHLEHFNGEAELIGCFEKVLHQTTGTLCVCRDDQRAWRTVAASACCVLSYGLHVDADLRAVDIQVHATSCSFGLHHKDFNSERISIGVGGVHNVVNALGAAAAALAHGIAIERIAAALPVACNELPARRFEQIGVCRGARFIADYAHHPVEIKAAVGMALKCEATRVVAVFQPHRYTRTLALGGDFPAAFAGVDEVVLLPVYAASERALPGGSSADLYALFRERMPNMKITLCVTLTQCAEYLRRSAGADDLFLLIGAGDIINLRSLVFTHDGSAITELESRFNQIEDAVYEVDVPLDRFTVLPTRGRGRCVTVSTVAALSHVIKLCRAFACNWRVAGAGFNSWFSDCGYSGLIVNLAGGEFSGIICNGDTVRAGCGVGGVRLLNFLQEHNLAGLEFMDGIPGTLGGWLAMNAGAHGGEVADCVVSVDLLDSEGDHVVRAANECGFSYRHCAEVERSLAIAVTLQLQSSDAETIAAERRSYRARRISMNGLRTAGSVFKNPAGDYAGRLLDDCNCRGLRVGGAYVTDFHANIAAVDDSACASDVLALSQIMRSRVEFDFGIILDYEIKGVES